MTTLDKATIAVTAANANWKNQTVFIGDNREVMLGMNSNSADFAPTLPSTKRNSSTASSGHGL